MRSYNKSGHDDHKYGYDDRVGQYRAKPRGATDISDDPATMVQEQIARIEHFLTNTDVTGRSVLDWGCGTGFNCEYFRQKYGASRTLGVDISRPTVEYARSIYPECEFEVGDICDTSLDFGSEQWDYVICCEVIEHVYDVNALLDGILRHLRPGGTAFISTPNKSVFSLGYEPSPVNQTHIKEYTLDEFSNILLGKFSSCELSGQRFRKNEMEERRKAALKRSISDYKLLGNLYWNQIIRRGWKILRLEPLFCLVEGIERYDYRDFEFSIPPSKDSIWFTAKLQK